MLQVKRIPGELVQGCPKVVDAAGRVYGLVSATGKHPLVWDGDKRSQARECQIVAEFWIPGRDVRVGDEIPAPVHGGRAIVERLTPYEGPLLATLGEGTKLAKFLGHAAEMTIPGGYPIRLFRRNKVA